MDKEKLQKLKEKISTYLEKKPASREYKYATIFKAYIDEIKK
jgi:hypothetical protein